VNEIRVRRADEGDAAAIAEVHVRAWQAAYRGVLPDVLLDGLSVAEREESWRALLGDADGRRLTLVAESPSGEVAGFCAAETPGVGEGADGAAAEIGALYVDPPYWRQGIGSAMLSAALREIGARGLREAILWVLPENRAAIAFYERFGFAVEEGSGKREERSGRRVIRMRATLPGADQPIELVPYDPS
jgi:ribosomal protein S18 acetylase RimI-like enzyme